MPAKKAVKAVKDEGYDIAARIKAHPERLGRRVGFLDLTSLHGEWIRQMVFGAGDYTLQAHRGSYKSSCLAVAISLLLVLQPDKNIIFIRKADNDVSEMLGMVAKILRTEVFNEISMAVHRLPLSISAEGSDHLSTNLWTSPMGSYQLLGIGLRASITGKHAYYVITDDICNLTDRISRAERERTKLQYDELQNIRNRGGRIINLGTPWHEEDVFSKMPNIHRYDCYQTGLLTREKIRAKVIRMLDVNKLIVSVEECLGWPYVSPGTNDSRGIDCSGLFVKAYRDQGASIYHGSNTIYRKYCSEKGKLSSVSQLKPGMAVFKWNPNTPEKFNDGLGDFQHIGLVTSVNPLRIVHASSAAGCVTTDEKLGKWAYWGWLKDVAKTDSLPPTPDEPTEGDEEPMAEFATVIADSGSTVNMRTKAKSTAALVERVPIGARVEILGTCGSWTKVKFGSRTGYMMSQFLTAEEPLEPDEDLTLEERVTRLEKRVAMLEMKDGAVG